MNGPELPSRNLRLVELKTFEDIGRPWLMVHTVRTTFLVAILLVSVVYQIHLGNFLNVEIWMPVYAILFVNFLLNSVYLFLFDRVENQARWNAALFALDTVAVTALIHFTGTGQSLFLFLYLINLILGGLIFGRDGSWLLAFWTSMCFSALLIFSPDVLGQSLYFSLAVNNLAFAAVTFLSGRLAAQLTAVDSRLQETHSDLLALQNLNELIVNNVTTGLVVISRTGFVQFFNPTSEKILGRRDFAQVKIQDLLPQLEWPWTSLIEDETQAFERRDLRLARADGSLQVLEVVIARFRDAEGKIKGWLLLFDDRTEQKLLEDTVRNQEKLAAVGQLAAGIAHEIRNPLASISGSVQLLMTNTQSHSGEDLQLMRIVDKEINRLNGLITEFLDYVRPEQRYNIPVNINSLIREVAEGIQFNPKLRKDVEQRLKLNAACTILGNRDKIKQALLNFVINAYQAMDKTVNPVLEIETRDQRATVTLIIRDNGCGIKPENLHRIFEPFHTTKPSGTGLGLAVTHKILQAHEAKIFVESIAGEGTKFVIEFPAHRDVHTEDLIPLKQVTKG